MKHLLGWKLFESVEGETYSSMPLHTFYPEIGKVIHVKLSESNIKRILDEFPSLIKFSTHHSTHFQDNLGRFNIDINEGDDEWFYLEVNVGDGKRKQMSHYGYKCDQLQGVLDCIRDAYSSFVK